MKRALRLSLLTLLASGCLVSRPELPQPECTVDSECSNGKVCGPAGKCVDQCKADADCTSPRTCVSGACKLPTGVCVTSADCTNGDVCGLGNTCSKACTTAANCGANEACIGGACTSLSAGLCALNSDCPSGESCVQGRCAAGCSMNVDCTSPRTCQSGSCLLPTGKCVVATDCAMGEVCGVGGACTTACTTAAQCDANEACIGGACTSLASGACRFNSECPSPQACVQGRCSEACMTSRDCPFGTECQTGFCAPQPPECLDATDCASMETCSPQGDCVRACTSVSDCAAMGEACSNGACVRVGVDTATIAGTVTLSGVSDASNLVVTVDGPNRASGRTAMNGSYSFQGLLPGLYTVRVTAPNTLEARAEREVSARAGATTTVPTITLTPAGAISGTITLAGRTSHEGIQVVALGTAGGTVTAPNGSFTLRNVPVGTYDLLVAFTGYQAAQITAVVVPYAQTATTSPLVLQPVPSGSTFAFASIPPSTWRIDQPFTYQAVAGGGGVSAVTYALVDGPSGATIGANTGQLSWTPELGSAWFTLSATGGGATVYQLFSVQVVPAATQLVSHQVDRLFAVDGGAWMIDNTALTFFGVDGGVRTIPEVATVSGTITSREHLNGRTVSSFDFPQGIITSMNAPFGTLGGTWQGGVVQSLTGLDARAVQSATLLGGTSGTATCPSCDTITGVTLQTGTITSINDGRSTATGFRANTGLVGAMTATTMEDLAATFTPNAFNGQCVVRSDGQGTRLTILSHTATVFTFNAGVDPAAVLVPGQRYFIGPCTGLATTTYTFVDANRTSTPAASGRQIDIYLPELWIGNFALTATTAPPNSTLSFNANVALYNQLANAAANGFYTVALNAGLDVVVTDSTGPWNSTTHSTNGFIYDDFAAGIDIIASTTTTLTLRQAFGSLLKDRTGRKWVLGDTSYNVIATIAVQNGGLQPNVFTGFFLWVDARGKTFYVTNNTATEYVVTVPLSEFPLQITGSLVGRSGNAGLPGIRVPTPGLPAASVLGRTFVRLTNGAAPFFAEATITANPAGSVDLADLACNGCVGGLAQRLAAASNVRWAPGWVPSQTRVDFRLQLQGSPNFPVDSLIGRFVVLESNPAVRASILGNDASSLVVEVDESNFGSFSGLLAGDRLWLSDPGSVSTSPLRVRLTGAGASWAANEWVGASVISSNNLVVGTVTSNTATTLDLTVTNTTGFQALSAGSNFAFARAFTQGVGCANPGLWIRSDLSLSGAQLVAGRYTHVRSELSGTSHRHPLASNTTTGGVAYVCAANFSNLIAMMGRAAVFDTNGRFDLVLQDTTASWTVNQHAGLYVYVTGQNATRLSTPITSNDATSLTMANIDSSGWFSGSWQSVFPGARFTMSNAQSEVTVVANVTPALAPNTLTGNMVRVRDSVSSAGTGLNAIVGGNTANTVTLTEVSGNQTDALRTTGPTAYRYLSVSRGTVMRLTDATATYTPGELVGRSARVNGLNFLVTANTATTLTLTSTDENAYARSIAGTTYQVFGSSWRDEFAVTPTGDALALSDLRVAVVKQNGTVTWRHPFSGAQALTVSATPHVSSGLLSNSATTTNYSTTWNQASWSFSPSSLVNGYLRVRECSSSPTQFLISANTATSVTGYVSAGCSNIMAGWRYSIDPATLTVSGATLTPGALRGKRLFINGYEYLVRDNTASTVQLIYPEDYRTGVGLPVVEQDGTAWVLEGLSPNVTPTAIASDGASGYWLGSSATLARFDGTAWSRVDGPTAAPPLRSSTVTAATANNTIFDSSGGMTPGALVGKRLWMQGAARSITSNTANTITTSTTWQLLTPTPGTPYVVFDGEGFTGLQTMTTDATRVWLGTSNGAWARTGSTWSWFTMSTTESAPGAADGLPTTDIEYLRVLENGDVFFWSGYQGITRLRGTTWKTWTVENTESAPGAADGLLSNYVYGVALDGAGNTWFGTDDGAQRLTGTSTWTTFGPNQGVTSWVSGVWFSPSNRVYLATGNGFYELAP